MRLAQVAAILVVCGRMRILLRVMVAVALAGVVLLLLWATRGSTPSTTPVSNAVPTAASNIIPDIPEDTKKTEVAPYASPFKSAMTANFFMGEPAVSSNTFIQSENLFYVGLPYAELDASGNFKKSANTIPWYKPGLSPLLKNHWVEIVHMGSVCFAQWEAVGPNGDDDFAYVFGSSTIPMSMLGERAALEVSPMLSKCLGMTDSDITSWRFVDASEVPSGPWKDIVTSSGPNWGN
jgi:hypothetical protein